jgi:glucose/arabinose dehydrogenase
LALAKRNLHQHSQGTHPVFGGVRRGLSLAIIIVLVVSSLTILAMTPRASGAGTISTYMSGLNWPIALAFASDGRIFFAERLTGSIRIIQGGALLATPFYALTNTDSAGERGLLGLALDPGFPSIPYVYAYQTYINSTSGTTYNRLVRIVANGNTGIGFSVILRLPPLTSATNHNGGVIKFGPDGKLYAVVGENANAAYAQDPSSPLGKVLRMNSDGSAPADNPFYGNASWNPLVYTYGHRNMFGLAFHPVTGRAYVTENGPACNDEINLLIPGRNYGWGIHNTCTFPPTINSTNVDGPNPVLPIWWWAGTICPTNAAIYGGPYFSAWQGDLFMGDCNYGDFHRLHLVPPNYDSVASDDILWTAPGLIADVIVGPDGAIWITTPTTIYRYWDSTRSLMAAFTATPNPAYVRQTVTFNGSFSRDSNGTIVSYAWNFGDSNTGTGMVATHAYASVGVYTVTLTIMDNQTLSNRASTTVTVRDSGPQITSSVPGLGPVTLTMGLSQTFSVVASDPDGDALTYSWRIDGVVAGGNATTLNFSASTLGPHTVNVTVSDGSHATWRQWAVTVVPQGPSFLSSTLFIAIFIVAILIILAGILIVWSRRRKREPPSPPPPTM